MQRVVYRLKSACLTVPDATAWKYALAMLAAYGVIYLPIGFKLGFLNLTVPSSGWTIVGVLLGAFVNPGVLEELVFRGLLIPHSNEAVTSQARWFWICTGWLLFVAYHLTPWTPGFFREPAFLIGAGLLGIICTLSYLQSRSIWTAVFVHWVIVAVWLLLLGGLKRFIP